MFAVGMTPLSMGFFSAASMTISLFSTVQIFAWIATLWLGKPVRTTSLLFTLGFIATFVIGGLSGVVTAVIPFDWQVTDTYFVVAHLHYVLIGANLFPVFAGFYYWLPKITGRMLDERLGRWSFWVMFVGFNVGFFPMHLSGLLGMRRRVYTYLPGDDLGALNLVTTLGAIVLGVGILLSVVNLLVSLRRGRRAGPNPWRADTLEWSVPSPPPAYAFAHLPRVASRHPLWTEPDPGADPDDAWVLDGGRFTLGTTAVDAEPRGVCAMPESSLAPLVLALALAGLFTGLLVGSLAGAGAGAVATLLVVGAWLRPSAEPEAP
jgi:heme/copper-type cytochrome/quinol oxidase subunit 1